VSTGWSSRVASRLTKPIDPILLPGQVAEYLAAAAAVAPKTTHAQATAPRESEE